MGGASHDPCLVADLILGSVEDAGFVEPDGDGYAIRVEHDGKVVTSPRLDPRLGRAVIARLAMIAELDLSNPRTASAVVPVRRGAIERDVVVTVRHGHALRCDLSVLPRRDARTPVPALELGPGDRAGHYVVMSRLGEGGMGTVYRVRHAALDRVYALKVLSGTVMARDAEAGPRFLREARSAARIRHPNIIDVFDYGKLGDGRPYLVMELLEGGSLEDLIGRGPVPVATVLEIARQLASALAAAHDRGIVHADVTPANVLVASVEPFTVKVVDFGLAVAIDELPAEIAEFVFGTVHYISPEQLRGLPATEQSDQYSLGVVLFELITGKVPFDHHNVRELGLLHLHAPVPRAESPLEPLPARLAEIVMRCMQKPPSLRFPGMRALLDALEDVTTLASRPDWTRWLGR